MDCKLFQLELPDLVLTPGARPSLAAVAHMKACQPCAQQYLEFQSTFVALDSWQAKEPTPFFDQKLAVRLREEQAAPRMGFFERLYTRATFNTGRNFRPAMAGALAVALLAATGGSYLELNTRHAPVPEASATVNDLQILDRNEQAFQQLDELQQDEDAPMTTTPANSSPSGPTT